MSEAQIGHSRGEARPAHFLPFDQDFAVLREALVSEVVNAFTRGERRGKVFGARRPDFFEHMNELRSEFLDRSELLFIHAGCVVALRTTPRGRPFPATLSAPMAEGAGFLLHELSLRWLVSACDTLIDHGETPLQRAVALSGSLLANTMKLAETERLRSRAAADDGRVRRVRDPRPGTCSTA